MFQEPRESQSDALLRRLRQLWDLRREDLVKNYGRTPSNMPIDDLHRKQGKQISADMTSCCTKIKSLTAVSLARTAAQKRLRLFLRHKVTLSTNVDGMKYLCEHPDLPDSQKTILCAQIEQQQQTLLLCTDEARCIESELRDNEIQMLEETNSASDFLLVCAERIET